MVLPSLLDEEEAEPVDADTELLPIQEDESWREAPRVATLIRWDVIEAIEEDVWGRV